MAESKAVHKALLDLETELDKFKSAKEALDAAHNKADRLLEKWQKLRSTSDQTLKKVYEDAVKTSEAASQMVAELAGIGPQLGALAKAVQDAGFPSRLDRLDTTLGTVSLAVQTVQNRLEGMERLLADKVVDAHHKTDAAIRASQAWLFCTCALLVLVGGGIGYVIFLLVNH